MMKFTYRKNTVIEGALVEENATHYTVEVEIAENTLELLELEKEVTVVEEIVTVDKKEQLKKLNELTPGRYMTTKKKLFIYGIENGYLTDASIYKKVNEKQVADMIEAKGGNTDWVL